MVGLMVGLDFRSRTQNGGSSDPPGTAHGSCAGPPWEPPCGAPPPWGAPPCWPPHEPWPPPWPPPWGAAGWLAHGSSPPPPKPPPPPLPRVTRVTLAVAYFRLGPTSSTSSSMTVRFSPSRVSYERALRRPCATTRIPFCRDSATFSAAWRQIEQLRNSVSPSFHSLVCRSKLRGVEAIVKFATAAPDGVNRSSGSPVRLPMMVMTVSPAMAVCLLQWATRVGAAPVSVLRGER